MIHTLRLVAVCILLLLCGRGAAYAQRHQVPEDQIKLSKKFFEVEDKCRDLNRNKQWTEAEVVCKAAVQLADHFADYRELEKMGAYEGVGNSLMGQKHYEQAISYYFRALEVARPRVSDKNAEAGQVYGSIGVAYHAMRNLDKAREFYRKAEKTYQVAYSRINPEADYGVGMRQGYVKILKRILEYHSLAAEQAGALAEVEDIKKHLAMLPQ